MRATSEELKNIINYEKSLLTENERIILNEYRDLYLENMLIVKNCCDSEYEVLTEEEKMLNNSRKRINYILNKEIEYCILSKSIPRRMYESLKMNAKSIVSNGAFAPLLIIFAYYLEHKKEIDIIVSQIVSGLRKHQYDSSTSTFLFEEISIIAPDKILQGESEWKYELMDLSLNQPNII